MEESVDRVDEVVEETIADASAVDMAGADEWAAIHERYDQGALTDDDMDAIADLAIRYVRELLAFFGETGVTIDEYEGDDGELILDVSGGNLAVLIGRHGRTLDAFQAIVSAFMSNTLHFHYPISIDIEGYKTRRREKLEALALSGAERAKRQHGQVKLAPMNAYERRIVHLALVDDVSVSTHSEGEDPQRRVVITYVR